MAQRKKVKLSPIDKRFLMYGSSSIADFNTDKFQQISMTITPTLEDQINPSPLNIDKNQHLNNSEQSPVLESRLSRELFITRYRQGIENLIIRPHLVSITDKFTKKPLGEQKPHRIENLDSLFRRSEFPASFELLDKGTLFEYLPTRWIRGKVPYLMSSELQKNKELTVFFKESFEIFQTLTVVRFIPIEFKLLEELDYVVFDLGANLEVPTGRYPGKNMVKIPPSSTKPAVLHILMHVIGFCHQSLSENKKEQHTYLCSNNLPSQFYPVSSSSVIPLQVNLYGPYDKMSVMHLPACSDMKTCSKKEIVSNVKTLSDLDIKKVMFFYGNKKCTFNYFKTAFSQSHVYCSTCWGESDLPVCVFCFEVHHKGHQIRKIDPGTELNDVLCVCAKLEHLNLCSVYLSMKIRVEAFRCETCSEVQKIDVVVCSRCCNICHFQHILEKINDMSAQSCGCGKSSEIINHKGKKVYVAAAIGCCLKKVN